MHTSTHLTTIIILFLITHHFAGKSIHSTQCMYTQAHTHVIRTREYELTHIQVKHKQFYNFCFVIKFDSILSKFTECRKFPNYVCVFNNQYICITSQTHTHTYKYIHIFSRSHNNVYFEDRCVQM